MFDTKSGLAVAALAVCAPLLLASAPALDDLSFAPARGSAVSKTFTNVFQFSMDDMTMLMNGEENPMMPTMEMEMTISSEVQVEDTYGDVEGGRVQRLTRRYERIGQDIEVDTVTESMGQTERDSVSGTGTSELEGRDVVFTWDAAAGAHATAFAEGTQADEALLEGLVEDMSLRCLLPRGPVAVGDEWEIPLESLVDVLAPGGDLHFDIEMDGQAAMQGPDPTMMADMREMFGDMLEGEALGRYAGTREVDGARLAVIEVAIELDTSKDMSELLEQMMGETAPETREMSLDRVDVEFALKSKGELLWDLDRHHVHSLQLEGESAIAMDMVVSMDFGGNAMTLEMSMEMSGTVSNSVETK
jgi:hypothetical protein